MRKPPCAAAFPDFETAEADKHKLYTRISAAVQVSRPSKIRSRNEATAARSLWLFDIKIWLQGPPGLPMPLLRDYGMNLAQPSSDEVLVLIGGLT